MISTLWFWESDSTDSLKTFSPSFHFRKFQYASTHSPFGQSDITEKNNPTKLRDIFVLKIPIHLNALLLLNGLTASHIVFNEVRVVLSPALAEMEKGWSRCKIKCTLKTLLSNIFVLFAWCTLCGILLGQRGYSPEIKKFLSVSTHCSYNTFVRLGSFSVKRAKKLNICCKHLWSHLPDLMVIAYKTCIGDEVLEGSRGDIG